MKRRKYGFIYKTHLFGRPTVRVMGADNVRRILLGEHRLVSVHWPASVRTILGSGCLSNLHDSSHKQRKKVRAGWGLLGKEQDSFSGEVQADKCKASASRGGTWTPPSSRLAFPAGMYLESGGAEVVWPGTQEGEMERIEDFNDLGFSGPR